MVLILTIPNAMLDSKAATTASRLETLPAELISDIFKLANLSARINLSLTSRFMARVATEGKELEVECDKMTDSAALSLLEDQSVPIMIRPRPANLSSLYLRSDSHYGVQFMCRHCEKWCWLTSPVEGRESTVNNRFYMRHVKGVLAKYHKATMTKGYVIVFKAVLSVLIERARKQKKWAGFLTLKYRQ